MAYEARVSRELGAPFSIREPDASGVIGPSPRRFRSMRQLVMRLRELDLGRWREADAAQRWAEIEASLDPSVDSPNAR
jgi:hypothetical protein